jgi:DNA-directed RNA polymerase specialized sigma24 family protein
MVQISQAVNLENDREYLISFCRPIVGDDAPDIVQEAYLKALDVGSLDLSLLRTIAKRLCIDKLRAETTRVEYEQKAAKPEAYLEPELDVLAAVNQLSDEVRTVISERYLNNRTHRYIQRKYGWSFGRQVDRQRQGLQQLAELL